MLVGEAAVDRETVLLLLTLVLAGLAFRLGPLLPGSTVPGGTPRRVERHAWRAVWIPLIPVAVILSAVVGWALREPDNAELAPLTIVLASLPFAGVCCRAICRAAASGWRTSGTSTSGVVGVFRPRIVISDQFRRRVDERALAAAAAHEAAHVRHRDPLRLWLAQFVTDLQWPSRCASERLRMWLGVVELARDDEARRAGIDGADLAAAILAAVRMQAQHHAASPALTGDALDLDRRIRRLLCPLPADEPATPSRQSLSVAVVLPVLIGVCVAGAVFGEPLVRTAFRVLP